jgi:hypothetical protein
MIIQKVLFRAYTYLFVYLHLLNIILRGILLIGYGLSSSFRLTEVHRNLFHLSLTSFRRSHWKYKCFRLYNSELLVPIIWSHSPLINLSHQIFQFYQVYINADIRIWNNSWSHKVNTSHIDGSALRLSQLVNFRLLESFISFLQTLYLYTLIKGFFITLCILLAGKKCFLTFDSLSMKSTLDRRLILRS